MTENIAVAEHAAVGEKVAASVVDLTKTYGAV